MSKSVKEMMIREYQTRFEGTEDAAVISIRGVDANSTNEIRRSLASKDIRISMVQNALARKAFEGTGLEALGAALKGSNVVAFGAESVVEVAREVVDLVKQFPEIQLKGAVLDGQLFDGDAGVRELSKFPTRDEAIAQTVTLILSPARNLMGQVKGPGARLAGIVKAIEEKLEKGEEIAKAG